MQDEAVTAKANVENMASAEEGVAEGMELSASVFEPSAPRPEVNGADLEVNTSELKSASSAPSAVLDSDMNEEASVLPVSSDKNHICREDSTSEQYLRGLGSVK